MKPVLLFDADCRFCTVIASQASRLRLQAEVRALQSVDLQPLGVSPERAMAEVPLVQPDGRVLYGHAAIAAALRTGPAPVRLIGRCIVMPGVDGAAAAAYRWVARHRHQLPGGTAACVLPPSAPDDPR